MYTPCTWQCTGRATAVFTGRSAGCTSMYGSCTRPWTRTACVHGPYTKPIEFATFSQTFVITSVNKTKLYFASHRKFTKYHGFLQRAQLHCKRCISYGNSVRLSVCLSVRLSDAGIVSKRRHVARCSFHRWIAKCV